MDRLQEVIDYYEREIKPYRFTYTAKNNLTLSFTIEPEQVPHLLFGTVDGVKNAASYRGIKGYNNIKGGIIKIDTLPGSIKSKAKQRINAFTDLHLLLGNPKGIFYNKKLVERGNALHTKISNIDAEYLLFNVTVKGQRLHLFLANCKQGKETFLVPMSFFSQPLKEVGYIKDQIEFDIYTKSKTFK